MSKSVGEYLLKDKIGKGSYADVYRGFHKVSGVKYAIKTIFKENLSDPKLLQGLESEIKIMREFNHENIVKLYEYFSSEKNFYLVLEMCEGGDLSKFIKKRKRLPERVAHSFLLQLANGLSFLQERHFIHRDLKPANVLLSENSEDAVLKLADFGFARHLTAATLAQTRCGTPLYMAPEILESRDYDAKADIWSVGCILYEMLVGVYPFRGTNEADLLNNIKTKELTIPKDIEVSKPSIDVLIKLLERNPLRRATVEQLSVISTQLVKFSGGTARDAALFPEGYSFNGGVAPESKRSGSGEGPSSAAAAAAAAGVNSSINLSPLAGGSRQTDRAAAINPSTATTMIMTKVAAYGGPIPPDGHQRRYSEDLTSSSGNNNNNNGNISRFEESNSGKHQPPAAPAQHQGTPPQGNLMSPSAAAGNNNNNNNNGSTPSAVAQIGKAIAFVLSPPATPQETTRVNSGRSYSLEEEKGRYMQQYRGEYTPSGTTSSSSLPPTPKILTPDAAHMKANNNNTNVFLNNSNYPPNPPLSLDANTARYRSNSSTTTYNNNNNNGYGSPPGVHHLHTSNGGGVEGRGVTPTGEPFGLISSEEEDFVVIDQSYHEGQLAKNQLFDKAGNRVSYGPNQGAYLTNKGVRKAPLPHHLIPQPLATATPSVGVPNNNNNNNNGAMTSAAAVLDAQLSHYFIELTEYSRVYFRAVHNVTCLGDLYIHDHERKTLGSMNNSLEITKSTLSLCKLSLDDAYQLQHRGIVYKDAMVAVDRYVIASILYFHSLSLMKTFMSSFNADMLNLTNSPASTPTKNNKDKTAGMLSKMSVNHQHTYNSFKKDFASLFTQIVDRVQSCEAHIKDLLQSNSDLAKYLKFHETSAENILMHMAKVREEDASIEELRNIGWAGKLYMSAIYLIEAVLITTSDIEQVKRLNEFIAKLNEKYEVCRQRAEEVGEVW